MRPLLFLPVLVLIFSLAAIPARADDSLSARFETLLGQLGAEAWETREKAQREIVDLGPDARPLAEKAMAETKDPEVRVLLRQALARLGKVRWIGSVKAALEESIKRGVPVLVVVADGPQAGPRCAAGDKLRKTLEDSELVAELNRRFVLVWWNAEVAGVGDDRPAAQSQEGDGGPTGVVGFYFCTSRGSVRHCLPGWWSTKSLTEEMNRAQKMLAASDASECIKVRKTVLLELSAAAKKMADENPEEMGKPPAESEIRREVERLRRIVSGYQAGDAVTGDPIEGYLSNRMRDLRARWQGK